MQYKSLLFFLLLLPMCGCSTMSNTDAGVLGGTAIGATGGALIGSAVGDPLAGAALGGVLGAVTGGLTGSAVDRAEARAEANAYQRVKAEQALQRPPLSIQDVITLTQNHISDSIIIRQIQETNSFYNLTANDLIGLRQMGVSETVIAVMQTRRPPVGYAAPPVLGGPVVQREVVIVEPAPPPPPVSFGFGIYSGGHRYRHRCGW
jgi:hypothetical protein